MAKKEVLIISYGFFHISAFVVNETPAMCCTLQKLVPVYDMSVIMYDWPHFLWKAQV